MKLPVGYVAGEGVKKATGYGGFGQRMLEKMGWEKGRGLGKTGDGMAEALDVKKKEDNAGVGANNNWNWALKHWEEAYNSAVQKIDHDASSSSSSSSDSESSSDEDEPALGDLMGGGVNRDGTRTTASHSELAIVQELAKDPWGRWGRSSGKLARIREQEQAQAQALAAKLGIQPAPRAPPAAAAAAGSGGGGKKDKTKKKEAAKKKRRSDYDSDSGSSSDFEDSEDDNGGGRRSGKKARKSLGDASGKEVEAQAAAAAKKRVVVTFESKQPAVQFVATPSTGWWGASMFRSAGAMGGDEEEAKAQQKEVKVSGQPAAADNTKRKLAGGRQEFTEDDQTALYNRVHDKQRQGRLGLGQGTGTLKIAGGKWEGTKKTFDEEAGAGSGGDEDDDDCRAAGSDGAPNGVLHAELTSSDEDEEGPVHADANGRAGRQESKGGKGGGGGKKRDKKKQKKIKRSGAGEGSSGDEEQKEEEPKKAKRNEDKSGSGGKGDKASKKENSRKSGGAELKKKLIKPIKAALKAAPGHKLKLSKLLKRLAADDEADSSRSGGALKMEQLAELIGSKGGRKGVALSDGGKYACLQRKQPSDDE